ncbi:MAG TPA: sugar phosphate isomerase/epimerase [Bryobacteraceae bacterium]|nr:sugar phosphate isomerase/epimerase [Bryobacteraceae bacterium]
MNRRSFLATLSASLASAANRLPANKNIKWSLSLGLWNHFRPTAFTDILDVMKDTGFIGMRFTGYPGGLKAYNMTAGQIEKECAKRGVTVMTISFGGPAHDPAQQQKMVANAREAMNFLKTFGADRLVVFSPGRVAAGGDVKGAFKTMCDTFNKIGETAGEMGFRAGLHNHLDQMVEKPEEVHQCMAMTDPKLFDFYPDTAHLHLGGSDVVEMFKRYKTRLRMMDYKDAKWTTPAADITLDNGRTLAKDSKGAKFFSSIYDLGDGEIDFPSCHRVLKEVNYKGWICVDLDTARKGPRASYERSGAYIVNKLEPIYA